MSDPIDLETVLRNPEAINRSYTYAKKNFAVDIPQNFNFAFDVLDVRARAFNKTALISISDKDNVIREISYSDLSISSSKFGNALRQLGLQRGDFAAVIIGRIPEWYSVLFGCMKAGVVSMPGTNLLTARDIAYRVNQSGAKAVIVTPEHCEKIDEIRQNCPTLEHFIVVGTAVEQWVSFYELCDQASDVCSRQIMGENSSNDMMMAYFTSGTTALPKMVPRDYGYGLAHVATALFWMDLTNKDIHWTLTDTGWAKAAWGLLFPPMLLGTSVVLYDTNEAFNAEQHLKLIEKIGVTSFCAPPTVYRLFAQMDLAPYDLSSLRRCIGAGEPLNPEVIRYWQKNTKTTISDGYGQTETVNIIANFPDQEILPGSMGQPVPGFHIAIVDDEGNEMPVNEVGHIAINVCNEWPLGLFTGYFTKDGLDKGVFRNGWYYTGDTARRDEKGYFWFVGRADDLISSAGYRISPFEVESSLLEHPAVAESAVVGYSDDTRGQVVMAYIVLSEGYEPNEGLVKDIQEFCKKHTAPYKYPRLIEFRKTLPKTISGKIRRVELRNKN